MSQTSGVWRSIIFFALRTVCTLTEVFQPANNKWLEKHQRHLLWQTALVQLQLRTNDNYRAA